MNGQLQMMMERDMGTITSLQKDAKDKDSVSERPDIVRPRASGRVQGRP